jgi:hypothetical protein
MFKVGEKRRPAKFVPGVAKIEVVRAVSTQPELDHDALPFGFVSLKWKAHDPARTKRRPMAKNASGKYEIVFSEEKVGWSAGRGARRAARGARVCVCE